MEPTRVGLLVLGAVAISSTTMLVATRRDGPTGDAARPLAASTGQGDAGATDLAALAQSIERLIDVLERGSTNRLEGASPGTPRQPVTSSDEPSLAVLLQKQNDLLVEMHAALLAGGRAEAEPTRRASELRATVTSGPRPTNLKAWEDYFTRYPPASFKGQAPVEVAVLGVADVLDRFGWPKETVTPTSSTSNWELKYRDIAVNTPDGVVTNVSVYCTRDGTYYVTPTLR